MALRTIIKDTTVKIGDTIKVKHQFGEGEKIQTQAFQGILIAIKGRSIGKTFCVRKIAVDSIGVERIWPVACPSILKVEVVKTGDVRRAKLYYLRDRLGKTAVKVKTARKDVVKPAPKKKSSSSKTAKKSS